MKKLKEFNKIVEKFLQNEIYLPIISDFLEWFKRKLELFFYKTDKKIIPKKWEIFYINLWQNVWSELNKIRPCIVYSKRKFNAWWTMIVIPLRSYKWKNKKNFLKIFPSEENCLEKISLADVFAIKQVDKRRILNRVWKLENKYLEKIDNILLKILDIKK